MKTIGFRGTQHFQTHPYVYFGVGENGVGNFSHPVGFVSWLYRGGGVWGGVGWLADGLTS